jgi:hypothetical protein
MRTDSQHESWVLEQREVLTTHMLVVRTHVSDNTPPMLQTGQSHSLLLNLPPSYSTAAFPPATCAQASPPLLPIHTPGVLHACRRERMLLAAAACRSWCTLAPALGIMPHGAALAAGLSGRRWQVLAPIVGVGLFRPLQQQVRKGGAWAGQQCRGLPCPPGLGLKVAKHTTMCCCCCKRVTPSLHTRTA